MPSRRRTRPTPTPNVELGFFLVCDEVRIEAGSNKGIFIGVYTGPIIGNIDPLPLDRLTLVFSFRKAKDRARTARLELLNGRGEAVLPAFTFELTRTEDDMSVVMAEVRQQQFHAGTYTARLTIDGATELTGKFDVRIDPDLIARRRRETAAPFL